MQGSQCPSPLSPDPFFSRRCASAPTWTPWAGWCQAGRRASCVHTASWGWPPAWCASCSQSARPGSRPSTGMKPTAAALESTPQCQWSRALGPSCCCPTDSPGAEAWSGGRPCCPRGLHAPCQFFTPFHGASCAFMVLLSPWAPARGRDSYSWPSLGHGGHLSAALRGILGAVWSAPVQDGRGDSVCPQVELWVWGSTPRLLPMGDCACSPPPLLLIPMWVQGGGWGVQPCPG